jgi:hypothetical protein
MKNKRKLKKKVFFRHKIKKNQIQKIILAHKNQYSINLPLEWMDVSVGNVF